MSWAVKFRDELNSISSWITEELDGLIAQISSTFEVEHDVAGHHTDITGISATLTGAVTAGGAGTFGGDVTAQSGDANTNSKCRIGKIGDVLGLASTGITSGLHLGGTKGWVVALRPTGSPGTATDYEIRLFDLNHLVAGVSVLRLFYYTANSWWTLSTEIGGALALGEDVGGKRLAEVNTIVARASTRTETGVLNLKSRSTPAQITANQNNYAINGMGRVILTSDAARDITGIAAGADGELLWITNNGGFNITLKNNSGSSAAGNRIAGPNGGDVVVRATNGSALLHYDATIGVTGFWMVLGA